MIFAGGTIWFVCSVAVLGFFLFAVRAVLQAWLLDATPPGLGGSAIGMLFGEPGRRRGDRADLRRHRGRPLRHHGGVLFPRHHDRRRQFPGLPDAGRLDEARLIRSLPRYDHEGCWPRGHEISVRTRRVRSQIKNDKQPMAATTEATGHAEWPR